MERKRFDALTPKSIVKAIYTEDVMRMMTEIRKQWGLTYPEEE
jgi:hypothetical protein